MDERVGTFGEKKRMARIENYSGWLRESGAFVGSGEQQGEPHHLARISGAISDEFVRINSGVESAGVDRLHAARCTRLDLQVTFAISDVWGAREVSGIWQNNGLNALLREGGKGLDTVYIGSKASNFFWRVYVKEDSFANRYLRWELQLNKGDNHSVNAYAAVVAGESMSAVMSAYAPKQDRLWTGDESFDKEVYKFVTTLEGEYSKPRRVLASSYYKWLIDQVLPSLLNRTNDHTLEPKIRQWLELVVESFGGSVVWNEVSHND